MVIRRIQNQELVDRREIRAGAATNVTTLPDVRPERTA
jgi:hypothetical protein